jgi:AcrR family transcriptional regulator
MGSKRSKRPPRDVRATQRQPTRRSSAETRRVIFESALRLFRKKGFDQTTMREVAATAGTSLGSAYYYFASKEAIVLAYYEDVFEARQGRVVRAFAKTDDLRERLLALYHLHFDALKGDHKLLGALVRTVADPASDASVFSRATASVRNGTISLFEQALAVDAVSEDLRDLGALALWTLELGFMLYFVWDSSPKQERTRQLIDNTVDTLLPLLPFLSLPMAEPLRAHLAKLLIDANLVPDDEAALE